MEKSVVLLSGGMDSAVCLAVSRSEHLESYALTFDYGQRHRNEVGAARQIAEMLGAKSHLVIELDLTAIGKSALTDDIAVPELVAPGKIPATYVPARNLIFLSVGLAWAEALSAGQLFIGANQVDFSGYPDCRGDFLRSFEETAGLGTRTGREDKPVKLRAPLLDLDKASIIRLGVKLGVDFSLTHTCYDPSPAGLACGKCPSCRLRLKGFAEAGLPDPARYA